MAGPNKLQLVADIAAQKLAADQLVMQLQTGTRTGKTSRDVLTPLAATPAKGSDQTTIWTYRLANQLLKTSAYEDLLARLQAFPAAPKFYRADGGTISGLTATPATAFGRYMQVSPNVTAR